MKRMIHVESHTVELPLVNRLENSSEVIEFYAQPPAIQIKYLSKQGKIVCSFHTPDFFVIEQSRVGWKECKVEARLRELAEASPTRYVLSGTRWHSPPAEALAADYGFYYEIITPVDLNPILTQNFEFLFDYLDENYPQPSADKKNWVLSSIRKRPGITAAQLLALNHGCSYNDIFTLIARKDIYVDLEKNLLSSEDEVPLFVDEEVARAHQTVAEERSLISYSSSLSNDGFELNESKFLISATEEELKIANERYAFIQGQKQAVEIPDRTRRRWRERYSSAQQAYGSGFLGLLPLTRLRGNRSPRFPNQVNDLAARIIAIYEVSGKKRPKLALWSEFVIECNRQGFQSPGYAWFCERFKASTVVSAPPIISGELEQHARHGAFPWQLAHVDHMLCDVELVAQQKSTNLGRPWLSVLIDAFSRKVLAFHLSLEHPSYRACMSLLRDCVRRHRRVPNCIVADGGREFQSVYFESLLARYNCALKQRPTGAPHCGAVIERFFNTLKTQVFSSLDGTRVRLSENMCQLAKEAQNEAVWTLNELEKLLSDYLFDFYEHRYHSGLGCSPAIAYANGISKGGERLNRAVEYDQEFITMTLPPCLRGSAKVQRCSGIKVNGIYYWHEFMRRGDVIGTKLPVKYDPDDLAMVLAFVDQQWVECWSEYKSVFRGRSERERKIASAEILKRRKVAPKAEVSGQELAKFFQSHPTPVQQRTGDAPKSDDQLCLDESEAPQ